MSVYGEGTREYACMACVFACAHDALLDKFLDYSQQCSRAANPGLV